MHTRESEVLVKDIKVQQVYYGVVRMFASPPQGFGRSECLANEGGILLGAPAAYYLAHVDWR